MSGNHELAVSAIDVVECLRFIRSHLYAAQAQINERDDAIIVNHIHCAYQRASDVCREIETYGIRFGDSCFTHPAKPKERAK